MWNVTGPFTCNSSGLSDAAITEAFNRVAEDYRPFNINVTTNETKYNSAPFNKRMRVVITTSYEWYGSGAGGVAYINSFTWGDNSPCFVFSSLLGYSVKNIAEAASHEAGHTLGLRHQSAYDAACVKLSDYNWGQGTGEIGWAPIMGAGYNQNMTLWNSGPNSLRLQRLFKMIFLLLQMRQTALVIAQMIILTHMQLLPLSLLIAAAWQRSVV
jgi:hypothetical protein